MDIQVQKLNFENNDEHHQFPIVKEFHQFSLNKFRSVEFRNIKSKIQEAEKRISNLDQARSLVAQKLQERMLDRDFAANIFMTRKNKSRGNWNRCMIYQRKNEMEFLQKTIEEELNSTNKPSKKLISTTAISTPHDQINDLIKKLRYRIKHGKNNLADEKKLLREIKEAEAEIQKITADYVFGPYNWSIVGSDEAMKNRIKLLSDDMDKLKMENQSYEFNLNHQKEVIDLKTSKSEVAHLRRELECIDRKKDEMCEYILQLKSQSDQ